MHIHEVSLRFADIDPYHHVNNVAYAHLAGEARAKLVADGHLGAAPVTEMSLVYRRPLLLTHRRAVIESTVDSGVVTQQIHGAESPEPFHAATVTTSTVPTPLDEPAAQQGRELALELRHRDFDGVEVLPLERFVELAQEARVLYSSSHDAALRGGTFVIGRIALRLGAPLTWRAEPLVVRTWISQVARSTATITSQISDGDRVFCAVDSVQVGFDPDAGTSRQLSAVEQEGLRALIPQ